MRVTCTRCSGTFSARQWRPLCADCVREPSERRNGLASALREARENSKEHAEKVWNDAMAETNKVPSPND